jgi:hypothetical protein
MPVPEIPPQDAESKSAELMGWGVTNKLEPLEPYVPKQYQPRGATTPEEFSAL